MSQNKHYRGTYENPQQTGDSPPYRVTSGGQSASDDCHQTSFQKEGSLQAPCRPRESLRPDSSLEIGE